ncbi:MAG: DNA replication/repair protein RecF [Metallibacterium sp.]
MRILRLNLAQLRCFESLSIVPAAGINLLQGANGSGKTSVLEALFLLSHGRSFRPGGSQALIRRGQVECTVYAELDEGGQTHRLGLARGAHGWRARIDAQPIARLSNLLAHCAAICIEPGSHGLIAGPAEFRRRFLDWGVFHVEPAFLEAWQNYRRCLQQRNSLLRRNGDNAQLAVWEQGMDSAAVRLDEQRRAYLGRLRIRLLKHLARWLPELGVPTLRYQRGWAAETALVEVLVAHRIRDREQGHTQQGPHRADWLLGFEQAPERHQLSRGQTKLAALACLLAQFEVFRELRGTTPLLLLDDLAAELDTAHLEQVVSYLQNSGAQTWITDTDFPSHWQPGMRVFHVERGALRA